MKRTNRLQDRPQHLEEQCHYKYYQLHAHAVSYRRTEDNEVILSATVK
jgi:hypothetical protein